MRKLSMDELNRKTVTMKATDLLGLKDPVGLKSERILPGFENPAGNPPCDNLNCTRLRLKV